MAEIGILTFLHNDNFGSTLQAYALQRALREMGLDAEHLDYRPDRTEKIRNLLRSRNHPKLILEGLRKKQVKAGEEGARQKNAAISSVSAPCLPGGKPTGSGPGSAALTRFRSGRRKVPGSWNRSAVSGRMSCRIRSVS